MKRTFYMALGLALASFPTFAKKDKTTDSTSTGKMIMSGYLDTYYFHNFNNPASGTNLGVSGYERAFEKNAGQFNLGLVQTKFAYSTNKTEAVIDLTFGPNADWGNYGNVPLIGSPIYGASAAGVSVFGGVNIKQAYFTWKATSKLSFTAGQFGTHIGYEVIDAPVNYNYSLSNLFNNGPFYHQGLKGTYAISDKASLMLGVVNNWDALYDNNKFKSGIAQLYFSPVKNWNVYLNYIGGMEENLPITSSGTKDTRKATHLFDITTGYQVTEKLYFGLNAAYGFKTKNVNATDTTKFDKNLGWGGVALYSNYKFSEVFGLGARAEYFDNTNGIRFLKDSRGNGIDVTSLTLTPNFTVGDGHILLKPEFRLDIYKKLKADAGEDVDVIQQFEKGSDGKTTNMLPTLGLAAIYKF